MKDFLKRKLNTKKDAFTLLETILYVGIFSIVVFMIISVYGVIMDSRAKEKVVSEVTSEGGRIMQMVTQITRNATLINTPSIGTNGNILSLNVFNTSNNPTLFYLNGNNIVIKEGISGSEVILNSNRTSISDLKFTNLTKAGTKGTVKIEFKVTGATLNEKAPYQFSQTYYSDATLQ